MKNNLIPLWADLRFDKKVHDRIREQRRFAAQRVKRLYERRKTGGAILKFVPIKDDVGFTQLLINCNLMGQCDYDNRAAIAKATGKLLDHLVSGTWLDIPKKEET